jgi:hypothetical protein
MQRQSVNQPYLCGDLKYNSQWRSFTFLTHKAYELYFHCKFGFNKIRVFFIHMNCLFTSSGRLVTWFLSNAVCCSDVTESDKQLFKNLSLLKNVLRFAERNKQFAEQKFTLSLRYILQSEDLTVPKALETCRIGRK